MKNTKEDSFRDGSLIQSMVKLEDAKKSDAPPLSLDEILSLLEQTSCLLGQTSNSTSCHRRYNILSTVCSPQEAKNMLNNEVELLQTNDENPFRKKFSDHLTKSVKSKKSSKEVFIKLDDSKSLFDLALHFNSNSIRGEGKSKPLRITEVIMQKKLELEQESHKFLKAVAGDFRVKGSPTQLFLDTSPVIPNAELVNNIQLIKYLFSKKKY